MEEIIEKKITILISKSDEDRFNKMIKGFENFTLSFYEKTNHYNYKSLSLRISSTKKHVNIEDKKCY